MKLTGALADKIAARYRNWPNVDFFEVELRSMLEKRGLAILTDEARRDLIVRLGQGRQARNWWEMRERNRRSEASRRDYLGEQVSAMAAE